MKKISRKRAAEKAFRAGMDSDVCGLFEGGGEVVDAGLGNGDGSGGMGGKWEGIEGEAF